VPAANPGRIVFVGPLGIYGNAVIIDHGLGLFSLYGHLSEASVTEGAQVARGDPVGKTGDTGLAAGDHLHFSIMVHGVHVDAGDWWTATGGRPRPRAARRIREAAPPAPALFRLRSDDSESARECAARPRSPCCIGSTR
jgi:murein DD-endopeptidase MepM/ murein hydrolase activator NlpD